MADVALLRARVDRRARPIEAERPARAAPPASAHPYHAGDSSLNFSAYRRRPASKIASIAFGTALVASLAVGWLHRNEGNLAPDSGLGYWLGIVGASSMLLLLLYPLRKRMRSMRRVGSVALWFRLHMVLGLVGPVLILFHSNFELGSLNSNAALGAMLAVAISGLIGRFLYSKIHLGLYGRKAQVREILSDAEALKHLLGGALPVADQFIERMNRFTNVAMGTPRGVIASLCALPVLAIKGRFLRRRLLHDARRTLAAEGRRLGWSRRQRRKRFDTAVDLVTLHITAVKKAAAFEFFERLFGLWHVLHLPLFIILVLAASIHVVAAHFY
jgi:hypothetical protein